MRTKFQGTDTLNAYVVEGREIQPDDRYGYKVIAVVDSTGKHWAAYQGPTNWTDDRIARYGDKVTQKAAEKLFPTLAGMLRWND